MNLTRTEIALARSRCYSQVEGRPCDADTIISQIGKMTKLAVSGGRWLRVYNGSDSQKDEVGVLLPIRNGRAVEVVLNFLDLYTVRRVRLVTRGENRGEVVVEAESDNIYCDSLDSEVYRLSCWH